MTEYISRDTAIARLTKLEVTDKLATMADAKRGIADMPAADVAPVRHGHWIEDGDCQICSECGEEHCWDEYRAAYCDSCGAKMDGGEDHAVS